MTPAPGSAPRPPSGRSGRPKATSHAELERVAIELFTTHGYDATSVDDIAAAAGVSRRTFFRYFAVKPDVVWGDFDAAVAALRRDLAATPTDVPLMEAIGAAVVRFNRLPAEQVPQHRRRMELILGVPELVARSTRWYGRWRGAIAGFAADRLALDAEHLRPRTIAHCALGASLAAYEEWLRHPSADLAPLLEDTFAALAIGFDSRDAGRLLRGAGT